MGEIIILGVLGLLCIALILANRMDGKDASDTSRPSAASQHLGDHRVAIPNVDIHRMDD